MGRPFLLAAIFVAMSTAAFAQAPVPQYVLPPAPALPLTASAVSDGMVVLAPGRRIVLTLGEGHKPVQESEAAEAVPDLPVAETSRIVEDNLDNFAQPYQPQILPGRLTISLWVHPTRGTVLTSANGTNETLVYVAAILAKRPNGNVARALTTICATPAGGYNGQTWEDKLDAIQIIEIRSVPSRGCYNPRTDVFSAAGPPPAR